jgi:hypothetical protein
MHQLFSYYFWSTQPALDLNKYDLFFGYLFVGLLALAILLQIIRRFLRHPIAKKLSAKFQNLALTISIFGLVWFGFRYESTPVMARRLWAGLILLCGIIWLLFILKYLVFDFWREKNQYEREQVKNKYLPR